jgi:hypothetical protein
MNQLDYQLGLNNPKKMEDWTYADGAGLAKFKLNNCRRGCSVKHPFNKTKRNNCENVCEAAYNEKIKQIDAMSAALEIANAQQSGNQAPVIPSETVNEISADIVNADVNNRGETIQEDQPTGLSTGAKVAIGLGAVALIVGVVIYMRRKNK